MNSDRKIRDTRLLEVLDHLDPEYIDDVIGILDLPPANFSPERSRKGTVRSIKIVFTLAACLFLISACIPVISYLIRHYLTPSGRIDETTAEESAPLTTDSEETTAPELLRASDFNYEIREDGTLTVYYIGQAEEVIVPDTIDGKKVTAIGEKAFASVADTLKKVTLPETIEQIENQAFANCTLLSEINLPDSLTSIGVWAFDHCTDLKYLKIPAHAFDGGLSEAFVYSGLETVELAEGIEKIPPYTFYKSNLKEINLPSSLKEIGTCAFLEAHYLKAVNMNEGLEKIDDFAFMNIGAESISIPSSVSKIGAGTFMSCWSLKEISIDPDNKTFYRSGNCIIEKSSKTLVIGFGECVIPSDGSVTSIGDGAMGGIPITDLTIPDSVTSIGANAFTYCTRLKSISLPYTLKSIGEAAFSECTSLESISLPYGIKTIGSGTFFNCKNLTNADIPYGVESIGAQAFQSCEKLANIYLPDSLTAIGEMAFFYCANLKEVTVPASITAIPGSLFAHCTSLEKVTIGYRTASIAEWAFSNCPTLESFVFSGTAIEWYNVQIALNWNTSSGFNKVLCRDGNVLLTSNQQDNGTPGLKYVLNSDGRSAALVSIGDCTETEIVIASHYNGYPVTVIGNAVFQNMTHLTKVELPETLTTIEWNAFSNCTSLTSVTLPDGINTIGGFAFQGCMALSAISIPSTLTEIGRGAFQGTPITSIKLGNSVTYIGSEAFMNCQALSSVTLPRGITWLYNDTFKNCPSLTQVIFSGTVAEWKAIDKNKTWKDGAPFEVVNCSDGSIASETMTEDEAIELAAKHLNVKSGEKDPATGYKMILWVKGEPTAASPRYLIALSHAVSAGYYPIVKEVWVDIYTGECSDAVHDLPDIPENIRAVIKNEKTFILKNEYTVYFTDRDNYAAYIPEWNSSMDYVIVDLDGDGKEEMILEGTASDMVLILHDTGKEVRGYLTGFRSMLEIKTDGTFDWTDLTISGEYGRSRVVSFGDEYMNFEEVYHIHQDDNGNETYFVGGKEVSKEEYDAFVSTLSSEAAERKHLYYYPTEKKPEM